MTRTKLGRTIQVLAALVLVASAFLLLRNRRGATAMPASQPTPDPEKHVEAYQERLQATEKILQDGYFDLSSK